MLKARSHLENQIQAKKKTKKIRTKKQAFEYISLQHVLCSKTPSVGWPDIFPVRVDLFCSNRKAASGQMILNIVHVMDDIQRLFILLERVARF